MKNLLAASIAAYAVVVFAGIYRDIRVTPDHTEAFVAPTTAQVSEAYLFWLVNAGQQPETLEHGVDSSSDGTTWTLGTIANPVGPGQTAQVLVTLRGSGGEFPYWIDYWAQVTGESQTRQTVRLTIDTLASSTSPRGVSRSPAQARNRAAVSISAKSGTTQSGSIGLDGRRETARRSAARVRVTNSQATDIR